MIRHFALMSASIILVSGLDGAMAADMPLKAPPMAVPVDTWTGFYIGGNGGYGWDEIKKVELAPGSGAFPVGTVFSPDRGSGWVAGVQAGYNWQLAPHFVVGLEGEYSWADINGSETTISTVPRFLGFSSTDSTKLKDFALGTGRIGFADQNWLLYGKGGVAYGETSGSGVATTAAGTLFQTFSSGSTHAGWVLGAGAEWSLAPNWSARIEYDHIFFDSRTVASVGTVNTTFVNSGLDIDMVRAGINYRFNWGSPILAKY